MLRLKSLLRRRVKTNLQHELTDRLMDKEASDLITSCDANTRDAARVRSCAGPGAGAWLLTVPAHKGLELDNSTFLTACLLRLGLPLPPALTASACVCGAELDPYGDHLFCCKRGKERHFRHDVLVEEFRRIMSEVKLPAESEVTLRRLRVFPHNVDPDEKRMDLYWVEEGKGRLGDVTVAHPTRDDSTNENRKVNRANGRRDGRAGMDADAKKKRKYGSAARAGGHDFTAVPVETFDRWSAATASLLRRLARRLRVPCLMDECEETFHRDTAVDRWWARLSVLLQKGNVQMIERRVARAVAGEERAFAPFSQGELLERGAFNPR